MAAPIEVYRSSVQARDIDQMGHMNVQFYMAKATIGLAVLGHHLGLGPRYQRREGLRAVPREYHVRFLREQRLGAPLTITAGILDVGSERLRIYEEMTNVATGEIAATFVADVELEDIESGVTRPFPSAVREAAKGLLTTLPDYAAPRGLQLHPPRRGPRLSQADELGMLSIYKSVVTADMCEADRCMGPRAFMGVISDGIPNLLVQMHGVDRSRSKTGGAALEYRFVYHRRPVIGDLITVRSAIKDVAPKSYTFCHWLFDLESGEAVATAEAVAIMFDLEARKAVPIPDDIRSNLERFIIPDIGA